MEYHGLSSAQVLQKEQAGQVNGTVRRLTRSRFEIVRDHILTFFNFLNGVLFVMVLITGRFQNGAFIGTVVFNALIGIYQELKAKKLLDEMTIMTEDQVEVCRDGEWKKIPSSAVVLEDLIRVHAGDQVCADCQLQSGYLEADESMLTGESDPLSKIKGDHIYAGTVIKSGEAEGVAIRVGRSRVANAIMEDAGRYSRARSVLQEDLSRLLKIVSLLIIPMAVTLFLTQWKVIGMDWKSADLKTAAAAVGMIPEGLVVLTSIALTVSRVRLSRRQVLVQDLNAIESLARVDTVCLDKTGTLTQGKMRVVEVKELLDYSREEVFAVMSVYASCMKQGNATYEAAAAYFNRPDGLTVRDVFPFSSDRKYAAFAVNEKGTYYFGAPAILFPDGAPAVNHYLGKYTQQGKRVLVLARSNAEEISRTSLPDDLDPCAIVVFEDVLRDHVKEIMTYFQKQKIMIRIISGDDPATVCALARQAGVPGAESYVDMSKTKEAADELVRKYTVFGRVMPEDKKKLVKALKKQGYTVAMTGDGVNDVPAIKEADVSIVMAAGSAAAKDSANIVLLNNDFGVLPDIINEGRRVINNITRASSMYLVKTIFSVLLSFYSLIMLQEYPFLPVHLTIISAFCVGIPTFLLQMEPSFERVEGSFLSRAFRSSVPSSFTVFLGAVACMMIRDWFHLPAEVYYSIFLSMTSMVYFYTLVVVYKPMTRQRAAVIVCMAVLMCLVYWLFPQLIAVTFTEKSFFTMIPLIIVIPFVIKCSSRGYSLIAGKLEGWIGGLNAGKHHAGTVGDDS